MAAGAVIIAAMREGRFSPAAGCVAIGALVVVVIFIRRLMAAQAILTGAIVAEAVLAPVAGVMTGRALPDFVPCRRPVTAAAIRGAAVCVGGLFPGVRGVAIGTLPQIVLRGTLVADFTIAKFRVVDSLPPGVRLVADVAV